MANILFLAHRIPYPPNKGDKIRSWHFLSRLLEKHSVHAGFFVDDEKDLQHISFLEKQTESLCFQKVTPALQKVRSLKGLLSGTPLTVEAYPYRVLRAYAKALIDEGKVDIIFLYSAATAPIIPSDVDIPIVTDLVDVDSEKWKSYSEQSSWPVSWVYGREAEKLGAYEGWLSSISKRTILVSDQEAELFVSLHPERRETTVPIPNGVDLKQFDPGAYSADIDKQTILFTGAMDYQPNIEAVLWFCREVWPVIQEKKSDLVFRIAGGPVAPKVKELSNIDGVEVAGYVPDMAKEIAQGTVCVAPLLTARGIQNKVLEAMAMGKPVVATSLANEGINAPADEAIRVADTANEFAHSVINLIDNSAEANRLGQTARQFVETSFTWDAALEQLDRVIEESL